MLLTDDQRGAKECRRDDGVLFQKPCNGAKSTAQRLPIRVPLKQAYHPRMVENETLLAMARRHVREGEGHVNKQRELVEYLEAMQSPLLDEARTLLSQFRTSQAQHRQHLDQIEEEVRTGRRNAVGDLLPTHR